MKLENKLRCKEKPSNDYGANSKAFFMFIWFKTHQLHIDNCIMEVLQFLCQI